MKNNILKNFIVFEGLDGSGKSSQAKLLYSYLKENGKNVNLSFEPTNNPIGSLVRDVLKGRVNTTYKALALLYAADREDHLYNDEYGLVKSLDNGNIEISDRYFYSSFAYQSVSVDSSFVKEINDFLSPEILIYIDADVDLCLKRIDNRGEDKELFEKREFLERVKNNFDLINNNLVDGVNFLRVDASLSIDEIHQRIVTFVKNIIL